ncbi:hypothetical protein OMK64_13435 [Cellulomonas fimi]|uniref:hypothetical protein n=1 Tax=Cellulomonas fimi TaxID=1708 RepID=UPI00234E29AB|nr:hypothetical protein [Cellulomonas fimi]MDC7122538.1 hypothetical protein [Cellulomonas fimi]
MSPNSALSSLVPTAPADVGLGTEHLDAARSVLDSVFADRWPRLVFVSGSLAAGLGHAWSDVDVYVVDDTGDIESRAYRRGPHTVQINLMTPAAAAAAVSTCTAFVARSDDRTQLEQTEDAVRVAVRLAIAEILHDADGVVPPVHQRRTAARRLLLGRHALMVGSYSEDVLGALTSRDPWTALRSSELALEHGIEAHLTAHDDLYVGPKFLYRRLARTAGVGAGVTAAWDLLARGGVPTSPGDVTHVAVRRLRTATLLMADAILTGFDEPSSSTLDGTTTDVEPGTLVTSPWFCPIRFSNGWGLAGPDRGFRVSGPVVRIWSAFDGSSTDAVLARLGAEDEAFAAMPQADFHAAVEHLRSIQALTVDPWSLLEERR